MHSVIFNPLEEYETKYKSLHAEKTGQFFEQLVQRSGVDIEQNRTTVRQYQQCLEGTAKLKKQLTWLLVLRVLMCITLVLIPVVILKTNPKIKQLREAIAEADQQAENLLAEAEKQMAPLNGLFTDKDALNIVQDTIPLLFFEPFFTLQQEADMKINYDFAGSGSDEESTFDVLAGNYNGNPFVFENKLVHRMGTEIYHGYRTIHWTETYRDSNGKLRTRTRTQTLHATVTKPKPFYSTQVVLHYCAQGGPELSFSRDASHLDRKSDKQIARLVKQGEKKLQRKTEEAVRENGDFLSMSNSEFEVLFDALDRTNEVQFRTLFTPLAQTNMVDLIRSKVGYGDDFAFVKRRRTNHIISEHSQGRNVTLPAQSYVSYAFDTIRENFTGKNGEFFKAVYFDFAPILAIPMYQERPVHSLKPIPDYSQQYSFMESEALANAVDRRHVVHPRTKTQAILKSAFVSAKDGIDETCITAYSYDIEKRVDVVTMLGQDGHLHTVPVEWDAYLPLETQNHFYVATDSLAGKKSVFARRNGLSIFQS